MTKLELKTYEIKPQRVRVIPSADNPTKFDGQIGIALRHRGGSTFIQFEGENKLNLFPLARLEFLDYVDTSSTVNLQLVTDLIQELLAHASKAIGDHSLIEIRVANAAKNTELVNSLHRATVIAQTLIANLKSDLRHQDPNLVNDIYMIENHLLKKRG